MPLARIFFAIDYQNTSTLAPAVHPLSLESFVVVGCEFAMSVFFVV